MRPYPAPVICSRGLLARHIQGLVGNLDDLTDRVQDNVARAIADTLANLIHETLRGILSRVAPIPSPQQRPTWDHDSGGSFWDEPEGEYDDWPLHDDEGEAPQNLAPTEDRAPRFNWSTSLALGCQAAVGWLKRQTMRPAAVAAAGVGVAAAVTVCFTGPGLLAAALRLCSAAEVVQAGVSFLARLAS